MGFFDFLSGSDARKDIRKSSQQANQYLDQGYGQSQGFYNQAGELLSPFVESGGKAQTFYNDLLGLNGTDARSTAQGTLTSDPLFQGGLAEDSNALLKQLNARGMGAGGTSALAAQRVLQQNYGNWLDRYNQAGQQGFNAATAAGNLKAAQGDNAYGFAATKAGNAINTGNAIAQTRNTGVNNILNLLGTGVKTYNALYNGGK